MRKVNQQLVEQQEVIEVLNTEISNLHSQLDKERSNLNDEIDRLEVQLRKESKKSNRIYEQLPTPLCGSFEVAKNLVID